MTEPHLTEREDTILREIVRAFLETGQPVASRAVSQTSALGVSPATIRALMSSLEDRGLLCQPHTSAGRVPTLAAVRRYASALLQAPSGATPSLELRSALQAAQGVDGLLRSASHALSAMTSLAAVASPPEGALARISHIEMISLSPRQALVVVVTQGAQVQHQLVELRREMDGAELEGVRQALCGLVAGLTLRQARRRLAEEVRRAQAVYDALVAEAVVVGESALGRGAQDELYVDGELNLVGVEPLWGQAQLRAVLEGLRDKKLLQDIFEQIEDTSGLHIVVGLLSRVGGERGAGGLEDCSLIVAPYGSQGSRLGWVGIVGPVRMRYAALLGLVAGAAEELEAQIEARRVA